MSHQHQLGGLQKQYQRRYHRLMTVACDQVAGPVHGRKDIFVGLTHWWCYVFYIYNRTTLRLSIGSVFVQCFSEILPLLAYLKLSETFQHFDVSAHRGISEC